MKHFRSAVIFVLLGVLVMTPLVVSAQDTATARNQLISQHCKNIQSAVGELQRRDLVSRTNLGREYESVTKQLAAFGTRVKNNGLDADPYSQLLTEVNDATDQFRATYVRYDDSLNALQQINCQAKPADFDTQLIESRSLRDDTAGAVTHAAALVSQYRDTAAQLDAQITAEGRVQ